MSVARASIIMIGALIASRILGWLRLSVIGATVSELTRPSRRPSFGTPAPAARIGTCVS